MPAPAPGAEPSAGPDSPPLVEGLVERCARAHAAAEALLAAARQGVRAIAVDEGGRVSPALVDRHQHAAHGLAWMATYVEGLGQMLRWARGLDEGGRLGEVEALTVQIAFGEYLSQLAGGVAMSQAETVRPHDLGVSDRAFNEFRSADVVCLMRGAGAPARGWLARRLVADWQASGFGEDGLDDDLVAVREQFRRYADEKVAPFAHRWHLDDALIPASVLEELAELGVFGLSAPEEHGGFGMSKVAMCVVTEELSRGYLGVGSLGTRTEIAAELIVNGGTEEQKRRWLPGIVSGEIVPTAVFTEPGTGSDLGALTARAERHGDVYRVTGNKIWITHAARADLMTLLVRTDPDEPGYRGLSMFLAPKPRGEGADPFPAPGMSGGEIGVLGYRGMKEYEIGFDGFEVEARNLLGGEEGRGFKQLMATFESARIQTGARAVGVAQAALERGLAYAAERRQFGRPIAEFPRVANKLAWMAVETMLARQLCRFAARAKDAGRRLRPRGRHGEAAGRPRGVVERRQRGADPRRQRLRPGIRDQPYPVRRAHPQHLRGRRRDPGAGDRAPPALGRQLKRARYPGRMADARSGRPDMAQLAGVECAGDRLRLAWSDGRRDAVLALWLRDNAPNARHANGQKLFDIVDLAPETAVERAVCEEGALAVRFAPDGHEARYPLAWLRAHARPAPPPPRRLWGAELAAALPEHRWPAVEADARARRAWLADMRELGFALLRGVPVREGAVLDVARSFGHVRETNYGALFDVRAEPRPINLAYTRAGLSCHTDNPYREPPPGLQLLHCLENDSEGGDSIVVDGFHAAALLARERPEDFALLTRHAVPFRFASADADLETRARLIALDDRGEVAEVRFNNRSIGAFDLDPEVMPAFYRAYRRFAETLRRPALTVAFRLAPGDLFMVDNQRVLHGRSAVGPGRRHLQGCYADKDSLLSALRVLERAVA